MLSAVARCSTSSAVTRAFVRRFASSDPLKAKMPQKKAESDQIPTEWQRKFLVITKLYKSDADIPQYVHHSVIGRMNNRLFYIFFFAWLMFIEIFYGDEMKMASMINPRIKT